MSWLRFPWFRVSDERYVEGLRRVIQFVDRWRTWLIAILVIAVVPLIWLFVLAVGMVMDGLPNQNLPVAFLSVFLGVVLGGIIGLSVDKLFGGMFWVLFGNRTERMLVKYYDAYRASVTEEEKAQDGEISNSAYLNSMF